MLVPSFAKGNWAVTGQPASQSSQPRRVNIPFFSNAVDESQLAIFWFGKNDSYTLIPGENYVDVRIGYSPDGLYLRETIIDYYLWNKENAQAGDDLTRYDAIALYLDTHQDGGAAPKTDDYYFLVGLHGYNPGEDTPAYRRQARGTGAAWDTGQQSSWEDYSIWSWSVGGGGPNNNAGNIDYGWIAGQTIPWAALGLSGPPAQGTQWGMGMLLYDQDQPNGQVLQEGWPETFDQGQPGTWGRLSFGLPAYTPQPAAIGGSVTIRSATPQDNTVEDAWMGGGGACSSGHNGGTEINHGNDANLFIGSEILPTHFPCFNKTYLRFALSSIPPGKVILSAKLTLHQWGGADINAGTTSNVWLSSVTDPWDEMSIQWNNAPLAQENYSMTPIPPKTTPLIWPGDPFSWDATQAVAEAYAAGQPASFALYDSATGRDSSKYFTSSETGLDDGTPNWNIESRPRLDIVWGDPVAALTKSAAPLEGVKGSNITYNLSLIGSGKNLSLIDQLPTALSAPLSISASSGTAQYNEELRQLTWSGSPEAGQKVTITYISTVAANGPLVIINSATLSQAGSQPSSASAAVCIDCFSVWLPFTSR